MNIDLTDEFFGDWVVLCLDHIDHHRDRNWLCACVCGTKKVVNGKRLVAGRSNGCGCAKNARISKSKMRKDRKTVLLKTIYSQTIRSTSSKIKGNELDFDFWVKLVSNPCHYCGIPYSKTIKDKSRIGNLLSDTILKINGVDRVDSSLGYTSCNVVPCCRVCNSAKMDMSLEDFLLWVEGVYNHHY